MAMGEADKVDSRHFVGGQNNTGLVGFILYNYIVIYNINLI